MISALVPHLNQRKHETVINIKRIKLPFEKINNH